MAGTKAPATAIMSGDILQFRRIAFAFDVQNLQCAADAVDDRCGKTVFVQKIVTDEAIREVKSECDFPCTGSASLRALSVNSGEAHNRIIVGNPALDTIDAAILSSAETALIGFHSLSAAVIARPGDRG